ncbi:Succinate dehydrogenase assembly factor 4, mitochondrial [Sergentomyia squamirostris]
MNKTLFSAFKSQTQVKNILFTNGNALKILPVLHSTNSSDNSDTPKKETPRLDELKKKLREKTPIENLNQEETGQVNVYKDFPPWPNNTNPHTGEIGGPRGPEPTRYGDWERKGRVSDF